MDDTSQATLRVALLAQEGRHAAFRELLKDENVNIVLEVPFELPLPTGWNGAEVLLADFEDYPERDQVERLLNQSPVPVLLNAGGIGHSSIWSRRLAGKLRMLANRSLPSARLRPELHLVERTSSDKPGARWLVVLGASIGGPKAVARFLQALPEGLPVTFLLAQHISESFQDLLAEQLDRCSSWPVALLGDAQEMAPGQVWLVPSESGIEIESGDPQRVRRNGRRWRSVQRPDIDSVLESTAGALPGQCGAILFSGLGKNGAAGCSAISERGGFFWAQSAESCVIPNLPEAHLAIAAYGFRQIRYHATFRTLRPDEAPSF